MQLHDLKPKHKRAKKKRVGRGGKKGTFSGRGVKGQAARSGFSMRPLIRDIFKRYPKLRGHKTNYKKTPDYTVINLGLINKKFSDGDTVSPQTLKESNLVKSSHGELPLVKILGDGELDKKLVFENCKFSQSAVDKIKKSDGKIKQ